MLHVTTAFLTHKRFRLRVSVREEKRPDLHSEIRFLYDFHFAHGMSWLQATFSRFIVMEEDAISNPPTFPPRRNIRFP